MEKRLERTALIFGEDAVNKLKNAHIAIFGIGGVGGYVAEALARSGVGHLTLVDNDAVSESNINRQIIALYSTVGRDKVEVMKERIADINPEAEVFTHKCFYLPDENGNIDFSGFDYIVDAIDTVTGKIGLVMEGKKRNIPVISSMGTGNKTDPSAFMISDIYKTKVCPLAKVMRTELKKRGVNKLKVLYSEEIPVKVPSVSDGEKRAVPGSNAFCPPAAGLIIASEVVKDIIKKG